MDVAPTVFVVEHESGTRESIKLLVRSHGFATEVFDSANEFLAAFDASRTGCIVVDALLPGDSGLDLQTRLADYKILTPLIFVAARADVASAVRAMRNGALDYIEAPINPVTLIDRIREAIRCDAKRRAELVHKREIRRRIQLLTPRENEVLGLVVAGRSNKQIASQLRVTEKTVEHHRAQVMRKLEAKSVAELVRLEMLSKSERPVP